MTGTSSSWFWLQAMLSCAAVQGTLGTAMPAMLSAQQRASWRFWVWMRDSAGLAKMKDLFVHCSAAAILISQARNAQSRFLEQGLPNTSGLAPAAAAVIGSHIGAWDNQTSIISLKVPSASGGG